MELICRKFILIEQGSCENIPAGYEAVSLIEALNGPCPTRSVPPATSLDVADTPDQEVAAQAVEALNRFGNFFLYVVHVHVNRHLYVGTSCFIMNVM
jgi:hypothetical protein